MTKDAVRFVPAEARVPSLDTGVFEAIAVRVCARVCVCGWGRTCVSVSGRDSSEEIAFFLFKHTHHMRAQRRGFMAPLPPHALFPNPVWIRESSLQFVACVPAEQNSTLKLRAGISETDTPSLNEPRKRGSGCPEGPSIDCGVSSFVYVQKLVPATLLHSVSCPVPQSFCPAHAKTQRFIEPNGSWSKHCGVAVVPVGTSMGQSASEEHCALHHVALKPVSLIAYSSSSDLHWLERGLRKLRV